MKLFKSAKAILAEVTDMRNDAMFRRQDNATVSEFFNGAPPLSDEEAAEMGFTVNVNHLFGYKDLANAKDQTYGLFTKPTSLFEVNLHCAPPGKAIEWGMKAKAGASRVLRRVDSFDSQYEGASGDAAMHGVTAFYFPNRTFPLPRQAPLSKLLVPPGATTDPSELTHFAIDEVEMRPRDLAEHYRRGAKGWNKAGMKRLLAHCYEGFQADTDLSPENAEAMEYRRQENRGTGNQGKRSVEVIFFYQQRPDKFGCPYDLTVLYDPSRVALKNSTDIDDDCIIYQSDSRYANVRELIHPAFMDCILGGEPKWHRVLGYGHLNYQLNHTIELMICRIQQGGIEASMNLWKATNSATREAMQEVLLHHNAIVPEGMDLIQQRYQPNFAGMLELVQFFRQQGKANISGSTQNNGDKNDLLEIQELALQNEGAAMTNARFSKWYRRLDFMWEEAFARLTNCYIDEREAGYSIVKDFQDEMEREGIPLWYLQRENTHIEAVRLLGDGVRTKELGIVQYLTTNRAQYAPEMQPRITRLCTALALDNYALAEQLTPIQEEPDAPQQLRADSENAVMLIQRTPLKPKPDDIDELHIGQHFPAMELLIKDALQYQKGGFLPQQAEAFQAVGGHILAHIQRIEERAKQPGAKQGDKEKARAYMEQVMEYARMGQKLLNNMEQQNEGQEVDPVEMQKLQLAAQQLQLSREKLQFSMMKFDRSQSLKEQTNAFNQNLSLNKEFREETKQRQDARLRDIETALNVVKTQTDKKKAEQPAAASA